MPDEAIFGLKMPTQDDPLLIEENSLIETGVADGRLSKTQKIQIPKDVGVVESLQTYKQLSFKDDFYQQPNEHQTITLNQTYLSANEVLSSDENKTAPANPDDLFNSRHDF